MKQTAVTLMELLIVIVIIGILAAIAVPLYTNKIERTRGERTIANIELIVYAYKQLYLKNGTMPVLADLQHINEDLNLDLSDSNFNYSISDQTDHRHIEASRNSGIYNNNNNIIRYDLDPSDNNPDNWDTTTFPNKWPWHP